MPLSREQIERKKLIVGQKFGRLTVLAEADPVYNAGGKARRKARRMVLARCVCGVEKVYQLNNIQSGNSWSCGCYDLERLAERNAELSKPQVWSVDGAIAYIMIGSTKALIDADDVPKASWFRWYVDGQGYIDTQRPNASLGRLILGLERDDPREVDHKFHVNHDNRKSEIRIATSSQNKMNRCGKKKSASRFKGVSPDRERGGFKAQIKTGDKNRLLGRFRTEIEAAIAYDREAEKHFGEFAWLNFPPC